MRARVLIFCLVLTMPMLVDAATAPKTLKELSGQIITLLSSGIGILVTLGIVIYMWGIASNMTKLSEGDSSAFKSYILWGIVILFVMVSIGGILNVLKNTVFSGEVGGTRDNSNSNSQPTFNNSNLSI